MRARPQIWWVSFTSSLVFIAVASVILAQESAVNEAVGVPNVAYLLSNLAFTVAAGSVQVYVHTLRSVRPSPRWIGVHVGTAIILVAVQSVGWLLAPVHDPTYRNFRDFPVTLESHGFEVVFHLYLGAVVANVAVGAFGQLRHAPADDPGRRWGLWAITVGAGVDVAAQALYLLRLALQPMIGPPALGYAAAADVITVISMTGIVCGTVSFLLVPRMTAVWRARQLVVELGPLHERLLRLRPEVAVVLPLSRANRHPEVVAERMLIEMQDALRMIMVDPAAGEPPDLAVVRTLREPQSAEAGRPASAVLPRPRTRIAEEDQMRGLAAVFGKDTRYAS